MAHLSEDAAAHRGVQVRPRLPLDHRVAGVRRPGRRGHRRDARQDQGDELRPRLRPVGVRPRRPARHRAGRGTGADGRVLRDLRRHPRLPRRHRRRGPAHRLHRDDHGPAPLPARPHQRQPAASRDGRADGAQRADPGLGSRPDQDRDAQRRPGDLGRRPGLTDAAPGPRRARVRGRPGRTGRPGRAGARADGLARPTCWSRSTCQSGRDSAGTRLLTSARDAATEGADAARANSARNRVPSTHDDQQHQRHGGGERRSRPRRARRARSR